VRCCWLFNCKLSGKISLNMIAVEEYVGKEVWCICLTKFEVYQAVVSGWDSSKKYVVITDSSDDLIDFVQPQRLFSD